MPRTSVEALLFDLGGVVIDIDFDRVLSHWARCAKQDLETLKSRFALDSYYEQHERGEIEASEYFTSLRQSLEIDITDEEFIAGWNSLYIGEIADVAAMLEEIKEKIPIYAFTNTNSTHQPVWTKKFAHLLRLFRDVFVSSEMGKRKPEPEAYQAVADEMGVRPVHILFFDDSIENIEGARNIGMQTVHVRSPQDIRTRLGSIKY